MSDTPDETGGATAPPAWHRHLIAGLAFLLAGGALGWSADIYREWFGLVAYTEQFLASVLALAVPLALVSLPAKRGAPRTGLPWYDALAAAAALVAGFYMAVNYPRLSEEMTYLPLDGLISGAIMVVLALEGLRRAVGMVLFVLALTFILYAAIGYLVPGQLSGRPIEFGKLAYYLAWDQSAMLGLPMLIGSTIVVSFVFFGQILFKSGGSAFFTDISLALMGRFRGGSAKIAITASALFGSISGSAVSNVVATGVITIPLMRQGGYPAHLAGAIEAVASTGGQLMPPVMGAAAFLMAEFLQVPYTDVVVAVVIPSLLYYVGLFITADLEAAKNGISRVPESRIPALLGVLRTGWYFPLPFVVLIVALFSWNLRPELAAIYAALTLVAFNLVLGFRGKRMSARDLFEAVRETGQASVELLMITAAAGFIIGALDISGLGFGLTLILVQIGSSSLVVLLLLAALVCIVLGLGMPTAGVYVLLAALVAPALVKMGISPMGAHLYVLYFGMLSMITPPVAIAAYAAASLAGADAMRTGFAAMRFGWTAFVMPFLFIAAPSLLMVGTPVQIAWAAATAVAGVWIACIGVVGYLVRPLAWPMRLACIAAGLMMLVPAGMFRGAWITDVAGIVLAFAIAGARDRLAPPPRAAAGLGPYPISRTRRAFWRCQSSSFSRSRLSCLRRPLARPSSVLAMPRSLK